MDNRYLALAIPFFFLLIGVELWVNVRRGDARYRLHDSLTNLSCGVGQVVLGVLVNVLVLQVYTAVQQKLAPWVAPQGAWWTWGLCVLGVDLCYYWFHHASHRVNFLWAAHAVHHQSQEYNLSAALRQSWLEPLFTLPFFLPLAVAGLPPPVFLAVHTFHALYQFLIHTQAVRSLGPLEWALNTPSHHRVHHAIESQYIDKNYSGIFILWDKLFGTFTPEGEDPTYGTVRPVASWNPVWANAVEWVRILGLMTHTRSVAAMWYAPFAPPEWKPKDLGGATAVPPVDKTRHAKFDTRTPAWADRYTTVHFALLVAVTVCLLWFAHTLSPGQRLAVIGWIIAGLLGVGALLESRGWARRLEHLRLGVAVPLALWLAGVPATLATAAVATVSVAMLSGRR